MVPDAPERKLSAIVSADVADYSRLMTEDEADTIRTIGRYREEIRLLVSQHRGRLVDFTGDNFLAEFPTATDAVECALEIQRVVEARNAGLPLPRRMHFRIGIHLGEVTVEAERLYGDGVNIAARLEGLAPPAGICVSAGKLTGGNTPASNQWGRRTKRNPACNALQSCSTKALAKAPM